jgi:UDP-glucose 4-epimerase
MKILFTGGSSFTGHWFIRALAAAGHDVTAIFRRQTRDYADVPGRRVAALATLCRPVFEQSFGDDGFVRLVNAQSRWDVLCHHAADVTNYKSADFDVAAALRNNTCGLAAVLAALRSRHCARVVLTGSVFEPDEGCGSDGRPAFSPYGLSKALTAHTFRYYAQRHGLHLGKFVIPNPFGPYEEARFTTYLAATWLAGKTACVNAPTYVRDNIHVTLLSRAYVRFVETLGDKAGMTQLNPSQYVETQGAFAARCAGALAPRLGCACPLEIGTPAVLSEPRVRINTDTLDYAALHWDESQAWDELAEYYLRQHHDLRRQ